MAKWRQRKRQQEKKPERVIEQSTRFAKAKRRMTPRWQTELDEQVKKVVEDPLVGEPKTGALRGVRVHKYKADSQLLLLAYEFNERRNAIELLDVAPHENFYRDLQDYLESRA